jgi:hypothetical protein
MILNYCAPCHDIEINKINECFDYHLIMFGTAQLLIVQAKKSILSFLNATKKFHEIYPKIFWPEQVTVTCSNRKKLRMN